MTGLVLEGGGLRGLFTAGVLDALSAAGIRCGVVCAPVIAYLTDSCGKMERIVEKTAASGAEFIIRDMGLFLSEKLKPLFFSTVEAYFPGFSEFYSGFSGNYLPIPRRSFVEEAFDNACARCNLKIIDRN